MVSNSRQPVASGPSAPDPRLTSAVAQQLLGRPQLTQPLELPGLLHRHGGAQRRRRRRGLSAGGEPDRQGQAQAASRLIERPGTIRLAAVAMVLISS